MKTLIELYDERPFENVLGPDIFRPERVIYLGPQEIMDDKKRREHFRAYFASRGMYPELDFISCSLFRADRVLEQLRKIAAAFPDCVLDITGGTDAALFAAGMFSAETGVPTFTYSYKRNRFYNINRAPFADDLPCNIDYRIADFFAMAGGRLQKGRADNALIRKNMDMIDPLFRLFLAHREEWPDVIAFFQRISQQHGPESSLRVSGSWSQKGIHGNRVDADPVILGKLEAMGAIRDLVMVREESVSFSFADEQVRFWLRDVGSALEMYMYKACIDTGIFSDVVGSAVVDWDDETGHSRVYNELDVAAAHGVVPLFISCKACDIKTEALNELAVLRDRFGGRGSHAVIATTEQCNAAARHRAARLDIAVIDLEELERGEAADRLKVIMKADQ